MKGPTIKHNDKNCILSVIKLMITSQQFRTQNDASFTSSGTQH